MTEILITAVVAIVIVVGVWLSTPGALKSSKKVTYGPWKLGRRCTHCDGFADSEEICEHCGTIEPRLERVAYRLRFTGEGMYARIDGREFKETDPGR